MPHRRCIAAAANETQASSSNPQAPHGATSTSASGEVTRNWGATGAAAVGGDSSNGDEEEEGDEKKTFKVRRRGDRSRHIGEDGTLPPARAQIVNTKQLIQLVKGAVKPAQR